MGKPEGNQRDEESYHSADSREAAEVESEETKRLKRGGVAVRRSNQQPIGGSTRHALESCQKVLRSTIVQLMRYVVHVKATNMPVFTRSVSR